MHSQLCTHKTLLRTDTSTLLRLDNFSARGRQCPGTLATMHSLLAAPHLLHGAVYLSVCLSVCYRSIYGCSTLAPRSCLSICLSLCLLSVYLWLLHTCYTELSIYLSVSLSVIGLSMAAPHLLHGATPSTIKTLQARSAGDNHPRPH